MNVIKFNSIGGASGDMILGSLISLGVDIDDLNKELKNLIPNESFEIIQEKVVNSSICGVRTEVKIKKQSHSHRHLSHIKEIINNSSLCDNVKKKSIKVFEKVAMAEAKIHGSTIEKVHFHEVGAVDSIVDIVGTCLALNKLNVDSIQISHLPLGQGTVKCAHGIIPVPAPATLEIIKDFPVEYTEEPYELVTPTAAAILMTFVNNDKHKQQSILETAYSFGHRKLNNRMNLLRASICEVRNVEIPESSACVMLECNIDDCTPELIGLAFNKLLENGALDVFSTPIQMKKQRLGTLLSVLCEVRNIDIMRNIIFQETTTFGIRETIVNRTVLDRHFKTVSTEYGDIKVKIGSLNNKIMTISPEISDCAKLAKKKNVSVKDIYNATIKEYEN